MTSESWAGFTDDDIKRIKSNPKLSRSCNVQICALDGLSSKNSGPMKIKNISLKWNDDCHGNNDSSVIEDRKKQFSSTFENSPVKKNSNESLCKKIENEEECNCSDRICEEDMQLSKNISNEELDSKSINEKCDEPVQSNTNLPPLEVFEMRQKRIEAENARRRALINKAINDKKMRTQAEAVKLAKITQELNQIDSNLSADVSILRNFIEKASLEFSEAEKRYLKAEKEFVEAKLLLFEKMQKKEMLTEHLCAIIEQNENRKADKLVELMKQLEMEAVVENCDVNRTEPILPNLCMMNDETYHCCQTLKSSLSKQNLQEQMVPEVTKELDRKQTNVQRSNSTDNTSRDVNTITNLSAVEDQGAQM